MTSWFWSFKVLLCIKPYKELTKRVKKSNFTPDVIFEQPLEEKKFRTPSYRRDISVNCKHRLLATTYKGDAVDIPIIISKPTLNVLAFQFAFYAFWYSSSIHSFPISLLFFFVKLNKQNTEHLTLVTQKSNFSISSSSFRMHKRMNVM